jgi:hypothetical protein
MVVSIPLGLRGVKQGGPVVLFTTGPLSFLGFAHKACKTILHLPPLVQVTGRLRVGENTPGLLDFIRRGLLTLDSIEKPVVRRVPAVEVLRLGSVPKRGLHLSHSPQGILVGPVTVPARRKCSVS